MYEELVQYYNQGDNAEILDRSHDLWLKEEERRWDQLKIFIDDFITSEEYENYLKEKSNIIKKDAVTQFDSGDFVQLPTEPIKLVPKYPLTLEAKIMTAFIRNFECYLKDKRNAEIVDRQREGIRVIRSKIQEVRKVSKSFSKRILTKSDGEIDNETKDFLSIFNFDTGKIRPQYKRKLKQTVAPYSKMLRYRHLNRKENIANMAKIILENIKKSNKTKSECDGYNIVLRESVEDKINAAAIRSATKREREREKDNTDEKEIGILLGDHFTNPMDNIDTVYPSSIIDLVQDFTALDDFMENKVIKRAAHKFDYPTDNLFVCEPKKIIFSNCKRGQMYSKKFGIYNISVHPRKFRYMQLTTSNEPDNLLFNVNPIDVIRLLSGHSTTMTVQFTPNRNQEIKACILFLSYDEKSQTCLQFSVDVLCTTIQQPDVTINTNMIHFNKIPIWQTKKARKNLTITNNRAKPCKVVIRKIADPLHLSDESLIKAQTSSHLKVFKDLDHMYAVVQSVTDEIVENVFNNFQFESHYCQLGPFEHKIIKIKMNQIDCARNYIEKYTIEADGLNDDTYNIFYEVVIDADVTGHFITVLPDMLDFGACLIDSIYQINMEIKNNSTSTQALAIKLPASIREYLKPDTANIYLSPKGSRSIRIRFFPRKQIMESTYFNKDLLILELPLQIHILTKNYNDISPIPVTVFSVVSFSNLLNIVSLENTDARICPRHIHLDLGECSTYETVFIDMAVENNTNVRQIIGFTDLPFCLTIQPNYGFLELHPGCQEQFKILLHPDSTLTNSTKTKDGDYSFKYTINLVTMYYMQTEDGTLSSKKCQSSLQVVLSEMFEPLDEQLQKDISICIESVRKEYFTSVDIIDTDMNDDEIVSEVVDGNQNFIDTQDNLDEKHIRIVQKSNITKLKLTFTVLKPLVDVSYQFIQFPDTACGSYSFTSIEIRAAGIKLKEKIKMINDRKESNFEAWFKITGDNEEIRVEPSCGILKAGQSRKLFFIASPTTPESIVEETARSIKYSEIYELKRREYENAKKKTNKKNKKDKKRKRGKEKDENTNNEQSETDKKKEGGKVRKKRDKIKVSNKEKDLTPTEPKIEVLDTEIVLNLDDYYPAEMSYWRSLKPYTITSNFTCTITYADELMTRPKDTINLQACCLVIKPDFISNLKFQRLDFGNVALGMNEVKEIVIQNIKYDKLIIKTSVFNPVGPFSIPTGRSFTILPESYLKLPIKFAPNDQKQFEEYCEITSSSTTLPLVLQGVGVEINVSFSPVFLICRLNKATFKSVDQHTLKIKNNTAAKVIICFEKVFEIEGIIEKIPVKKEKKTEKVGKGKGKRKNKDKDSKKDVEKKSKQSKKSKKTKKNKKLSNQLTPEELYSIPKFMPTLDTSHFDLINVKNDQITLEANATFSVRFGFGMKESLNDIKQGRLEKSKKKAKGTKDQQQPNENSEIKDLPKTQIKTVYIAKYNIFAAGNMLKELIFICSFK